jgi:hypothetical protein
VVYSDNEGFSHVLYQCVKHFFAMCLQQQDDNLVISAVIYHRRYGPCCLTLLVGKCCMLACRPDPPKDGHEMWGPTCHRHGAKTPNVGFSDMSATYRLPHLRHRDRTQLDMKSISIESINVHVTSCDERLRAGNTITNKTRPVDKNYTRGRDEETQ